MTIRKSQATGQMMAQCDVCFDVVDFEDDEDFEHVREIIGADGWKTKREGHGADAKWVNICVDCVKKG